MLSHGDKVGRYLIGGRIGAGGMGVVYEAEDPELGRRVALKLVKTGRGPGETEASGRTEGRERLVREAQAMARLAHPNVIAVYDAGTVDGDVFVAMELVDGPNLGLWLRGARRPTAEIIDVFLQAGRGLSAAHRAGLVHRDFKPDNVLVGKDGRARVGDFGLSTALENAPPRVPTPGDTSPALAFDALTATGALVGTPAYMSPEQFLGRPTDARSDQFSFCVALYIALTDQRPFAGNTFEELARHVASGRLREPPAGRVPRHVRRVLARGLHADPARRYPSMEELLEDLGRDPRAVRAVVIAACAGILLLGAAVVIVRSSERPELCAAAPGRLVGAWDATRRGEVRRAFLDSGAAFADDALRGAGDRIDAYAGAWADMHRAACEATHVTGEQSSELLDLRMDCLAGRRAALAALVDVFAHADRAVVERAVAAAAGLPPLDECADARRLTEKVRPPRDPRARAWAESIARRTAEVRALGLAGRYREGLALARALAPEAAALGHRPTEAAVLLALGDMFSRAADQHAAERTLLAAVRAALAGRDPRGAASAYMALGTVVGLEERQGDAGLEHLATATAVVEGLGGDPSLEGRIAGAEGQIEHDLGRLDAAIAHFTHARELLEAALGPNHIDVANVWNDLGGSLRRLGRYPEAIAAHQHALKLRETALGPAHPFVGSSLHNLGNVYYSQGQHEQAQGYFERALAVREKAYGPEHPRVADSLVSMAQNLDSLGRRDESLAALQRALVIQEKTIGADHPDVARTHNSIGDSLRALGRHEEGLEHYHRALEINEKGLGPDHPDVAVACYNIGEALQSLERTAEAVPWLARALAIDEKTYGPQGIELAYDLTSLGKARLRLGDAATAVGDLTRALALRDATPGNPSERAESQFFLAQALWAARRDRERALSLARSARATLAANAAAGSMVAEVDAWLLSRR